MTKLTGTGKVAKSMPDDRGDRLILPTEIERREVWLAVRWLFLKFLLKLALLAGVVLVASRYLYFTGWIPHGHDTPVWIAGDWMVGEYRDCEMRTRALMYPTENISPESLAKLPVLEPIIGMKYLTNIFIRCQ
jgi:hypothetical protein